VRGNRAPSAPRSEAVSEEPARPASHLAPMIAVRLSSATPDSPKPSRAAGQHLPRHAVVDCASVVAAHKARLLPSGIQFAAISTPPLKRLGFTKISASFSLCPKCSSRSSLKRRRLRSSTADPGSDARPCRSAAGSACCWQPSAGGGPPSAWPANPAVAGPAERKAPACQPVRVGQTPSHWATVAQPPADDAANSEAAPLAHRRGPVPPFVGMRKANGQLPGGVGRRGRRARRKLRKTRFPSKPVMLATENQPLSQAEAWLRVRDWRESDLAAISARSLSRGTTS